MLKINCDKCKKELTEPGGLFFSPPDGRMLTAKYHLCGECSILVLRLVTNNIQPVEQPKELDIYELEAKHSATVGGRR